MNSLRARPFRFLLMVLSAWVLGRASGHWLTTSPDEGSGIEQAVLPTRMAATGEGTEGTASSVMGHFASSLRSEAGGAGFISRPELRAVQRKPSGGLRGVPLKDQASFNRTERMLSEVVEEPGAANLPPAPIGLTRSLPARLSIDGWLFLRDGGGAGLGRGGSLGGSQAGVRIAYPVARDGMVSFYGRVSLALKRPSQPELAAGLSVRPLRRASLTINVERRVALDRNGRDAFSAFAATGIEPTDIVAGFRLEGYGQAGIVGARRRDAFVDGRLSLTKAMGAAQAAPLRLGLSLSGAAQPGASRLDIGPRAEWRPSPDVPATFALEWRQRIAGNAAPGSGAALTLATHF